MCSDRKIRRALKGALAPMRPAHGSTVFSCWSLARRNRAGQNVRDALMPMADTIWFRSQIQHATRSDWRGERAQGRVMQPYSRTPAGHFAKTHFNFVGNDGGENRSWPLRPSLSTRKRRGDEIVDDTDRPSIMSL